MNESDIDRRRDEMLAELAELPMEPTMQALEVVVISLARLGGAKVRLRLNELVGRTDDRSLPELQAFHLKLKAALEAAQDDGALAAAFSAAFPDAVRRIELASAVLEQKDAGRA